MSWWFLINAGNLMMIAVLTAGFFLKTIWLKFLLVILAASFLRFEPTIGKEEVLFIIIGFFGMILHSYLPFRPYANFLISLITALLLFNLIIFLL